MTQGGGPTRATSVEKNRHKRAERKQTVGQRERDKICPGKGMGKQIVRKRGAKRQKKCTKSLFLVGNHYICII